MEVHATYSEGAHPRITFKVQPDDYDIAYNAKIRNGKLNLREVHVELCRDGKNSIHPDLLGLAALLLVAPFTKREVKLSFSVSEGFKSIVSKNLIKLSATPQFTAKRSVNQWFRPGLAFSGGVDSCAALLLMPKDTVPVFLRRSAPHGSVEGLYNESAALDSCAAAVEHGFDVQIVKTSLEYIRKPVGNPVDWSNGIPAVLNADILNLNSISYGLIAESAYWTGGPYFSDLKERSRYSSWVSIFEYCGIPMSMPTASLSEVLTSKICQNSSIDLRPQSCVRGVPGKPCGNCFKCFRKRLVESALCRRQVPTEMFSAITGSSEIGKKLLETPIHHEIVLAWAMGRIPQDNSPSFRALYQKLSPTINYGNNLDFLDKYYSKGLEYTPESLRSVVEENIKKFCSPMSVEHISDFKAWQAENLVSTSAYQDGHLSLQNMM